MTVQKLLVSPHAGKDGFELLNCLRPKKGVKNGDQKKALLLHTAGLNLQDIYFTLTEEGGSDSYQKAKATLNKYSNRKRMFRMKGFGFVKQVNWQTKPSNSLLLD